MCLYSYWWEKVKERNCLVTVKNKVDTNQKHLTHMSKLIHLFPQQCFPQFSQAFTVLYSATADYISPPWLETKHDQNSRYWNTLTAYRRFQQKNHLIRLKFRLHLSPIPRSHLPLVAKVDDVAFGLDMRFLYDDGKMMNVKTFFHNYRICLREDQLRLVFWK